MPAPENVAQFAGELLGSFARGSPSPRRLEVNLLIDAVPLRPPIDEARPGCRTDKIVKPLVRPRNLKPIEDKLRSVVSPDSNPRRRKLICGLARQYARTASANKPKADELLLAARLVSRA